MTELLAAIGSLGTVGGLASVLVLVYWLRSAMLDASHAVEDKLAAERTGDQYKAERDAAVIAGAEQAAQAHAAEKQLSATQAALAAAQKELATHVRDQVLLEPVGDGAAALDELLGRSLAPVSDHAAASGDGQHPATAVLVAEPAVQGGTPRGGGG